MKLDFKTMDENWQANFKGGEKGLLAKMFSDEQNKIIRARLIAGATVGKHKHDTGSEIIFALSGEATATTDGVEERLTAGDCHYCPKGHEHTLKNDGPEDFVFVAVVVQQ
jgi:quercetin dioxygenase-like cupin family protein